MIGLVYDLVFIPLIALACVYRVRREPQKRSAYVSIGIGMSIAVIVGTGIAGGFG